MRPLIPQLHASNHPEHLYRMLKTPSMSQRLKWITWRLMMLPETGQALVSLSERLVPPRMRRMPSLYTTTLTFRGITLGVVTSATITGTGSSSRRGAIIEEFDERAPRVRAVLDAQGWTNMVEDHHLVVEAIVWEFYVNLHQRCSDSFWTWLTGTTIEVTPTLINAIAKAPRVHDSIYPYLVNHLLACADLVECFAEGRPHQMKLD
jgi:hypothetical protein